MAQQSTYILAPNFHFKPGTGPIALGNIIADPLRPHRTLTTVDAGILKARYPPVETFTHYEYSTSRGTSRNNSLSVWGQFLGTVGAKVSGEHGSSLHNTYTMDALETKYFVGDPALEELEARLKAPRVQAVLRTSSIPGFRYPVYMVTGLMVAKGFAVTHETGKNRGAELGAEGSAPTPAGQAGAGINIARSRSIEQSEEWKARDDIVFAYQLLKIEVRGWKGTRIEYDELRHKAAYLSHEAVEEYHEEDEEDLGEVTVTQTSLDNLRTLQNTGGLKAVELGEKLWTNQNAYPIEQSGILLATLRSAAD
ncbi:hypothetical protein BDV38DRAFT_281973 [Aspergillus pseudotamarii]|uniref:Uncharacterized protein n=1 Tax=Aspergillus pseudotamarii TaxID=132259 RepID=A0A5N6SVF6_ASPPS|nr:uncharacterized protein BDV38DRAFT_281973 [Aspergillus pseudotamarii]KAE8138676.1 hypothetical protein BDV38DRAFT_281973 [Aspergillus pseudotamarii]